MATFIVSFALALVVVMVIRKMVKDKKAGKGCCGGDCRHCSGGCH